MKVKVKVRAKYGSKCTVHYVSNNVSGVLVCLLSFSTFGARWSRDISEQQERFQQFVDV